MAIEISLKKSIINPTSGSGLTMAEPVFNRITNTLWMGKGSGVAPVWLGAGICGASAGIAAGLTLQTPTCGAVKDYISSVSFGGVTGATGPAGPVGATGPTGPAGEIPTNYVISFNGLTGAVTGVTTSTTNTFVPVQIFNSGISAAGGTFNGYVNVKGFQIKVDNPTPTSTVNQKTVLQFPDQTGFYEEFGESLPAVNRINLGADLVGGGYKALEIGTTGSNTSLKINGDQIISFTQFSSQTSGIFSTNDITTHVPLRIDHNFDGSDPGDLFAVQDTSLGEFHVRVDHTGKFYADNAQVNTLLTLPNGQGITSAVTRINGITGPVTLSAGTGITLSQTGKNITVSAPTEDSISIVVEGTPDDISTGNKGFRLIPYNCTPLEWYIVAGQTGSIQFDIKSSSFANYPNTTSIVGANYPGLSGAMKNSNTGITGWGGLTAGDIVDFVINSNTGIQKVGLFIKIRRNT